MNKNKNFHGMALITVLMVLLIIVMLTLSMMTINSNKLLYSLNYHDKIAALRVAEAGVVYALYSLQDDPSWAPADLDSSDLNLTKKGRFTITFNSLNAYFSCNNLTNPSPLPAGGYGNSYVPEHSVDLLVTGYMGNTVKHLRVVIGRTNIDEAARCTGQTIVDANKFEITRITTPMDPSLGGSFHSNFSDANSSYAISSTLDTKVIAHGGVISAVGNIDIPDCDITDGTEIREGVSPKPLPEIDINDIISGAPSRSEVHTGGYGGIYQIKMDGGSYKIFKNNSPVNLPGTRIDDGTLVFTEDIYFDSDTRFEFYMEDGNYRNAGIKLEETGTSYPSLYVNGTDQEKGFWVLGKVEGNGSIYNSGGTKFIMETDVMGGDDTGIALLSEGDISINLPASRIEPTSLSLTGAVLTHGNLDAGIMGPNHPDNPHVVLGDEYWPDDWIEEAYSEEFTYGTGSQTIDTSFQINLTSPPPLNEGTGWALRIAPYYGGSPSTDRLEAYGNGQFGLTGSGADRVYVYFEKGSTRVSDLSYNVVYNPYFEYETLPSWNVGGPVDGVTYSTSEEKRALYTYICDAINSYYGGSGHYNSGSESEITSEELYAPDISITGALMVVDPNNIYGAPGYNSEAGNIYVSLDPNSSTGDRGDFNLIHAKNYEKLFETPEINTKLVIVTWEEL